MAKIFHALAAVILAIAAPGSSAHAQDGSEEAAARTPEAAQQFLKTFLQRGDWVVDALEWFDGTTYQYFDGNWEATTHLNSDWKSRKLVEGDLTGWEALDPCTTRLSAVARRLQSDYLEDAPTPLASKDLTVNINWHNVHPVTVKDETLVSRAAAAIRPSLRYIIWLDDLESRAGVGFVTRDKEAAKRAAFAMSYLQQHCDPTAGSAF